MPQREDVSASGFDLSMMTVTDRPPAQAKARAMRISTSRRRTLAAGLFSLAAAPAAQAQSAEEWVAFRTRFVTDTSILPKLDAIS